MTDHDTSNATTPAWQPPPLPRLAEPTIAVVVCNYNYARYVAQTIESVLAQTRPASALIVVDDGSTDDSVQVIRSFQDRGVHVIVQPNGGQIAAYNSGLAACTADVVLFLDSDDALEPDALAEVAQRFDAGVAKVHFRLQLIGPEGARVDGEIPTHLATGDVADRFLRHGIAHTSPPASGNAYRRSVLAAIFPLPGDPSDRHGADFFCIYGATLFGSVAACSKTLGLYRVHQFPRVVDAFTFGNAEKGQALDKRIQARLSRFARWIASATHGAVLAPSTLTDFSTEKTAYATALLVHCPPGQRIREGWGRLPRLLQAIQARDDFSLLRKAGLVCWAGVLALAPHGLAVRAARYVCDPASRNTSAAKAT